MTKSVGKLIEVMILVALMLSVAGGFVFLGFKDAFMDTPGTMALVVAGLSWYAWFKCFPLDKR